MQVLQTVCVCVCVHAHVHVCEYVHKKYVHSYTRIKEMHCMFQQTQSHGMHAREKRYMCVDTL